MNDHLKSLETTIRQQVELAKVNKPKPLEEHQRQHLLSEIKTQLKEQNAVLVAHYYVAEELQKLAEETGGLVSDSLDMAAFGKSHPAQTLIVCGVRFMAETAKILSPEKRILIPNLEAECSLDLGCPEEEFAKFCQHNPHRTSLVYANTSAAVKGIADWVVTSGNAVEIVKHLHEKGEKLIWAPDRHLGNWIQAETGADIKHWDGHCVVHDEFRVKGLAEIKDQFPGAILIAHPESPEEVLKQAEVIGSTKVLVNAVNNMKEDKFIVATDEGIFYKMLSLQPQKELILAPTGGKGATCTACGHCPWMQLNSLQSVHQILKYGFNEIHLDETIIAKAQISINRMLDFSKSNGLVTAGDA